MIRHLVLFRFRPGTSEEQIRQAGDALCAMRHHIPEIREVRWGANLSPESAGEYSHVLTVVVDDLPAVERYLAHPVHRRTVADYVAPIREARLAVDLDT
ncbi:MAG TPA: Dabb family protein [Gemmatimonadales bacterium]|jgi:hypothetical protein|nr:Dabb family protein [Gemmatimonadales bacterium]